MDVQERSYINIAEDVLKESNEPLDLYELFDKVLERKGDSVTNLDRILTEFYTELIGSAKFIYTGSNTWDLKGNQKVELWTKDGSYYNEYKEVSNPEIDARIAEQKQKEKDHQAMLERRQQELEAQEAERERMEREAQAKQDEATEADTKAPDEVIPSEELEEIQGKETVEPEVADEEEDTLEPIDEEFEDDFDEDEYHDIMDQYEDEYDKE